MRCQNDTVVGKALLRRDETSRINGGDGGNGSGGKNLEWNDHPRTTMKWIYNSYWASIIHLKIVRDVCLMALLSICRRKCRQQTHARILSLTFFSSFFCICFVFVKFGQSSKVLFACVQCICTTDDWPVHYATLITVVLHTDNQANHFIYFVPLLSSYSVTASNGPLF